MSLKCKWFLILGLMTLTTLCPSTSAFAQSVRHVKTININYKNQHGFAEHDGYIFTVDHDRGRVHKHNLSGDTVKFYSGLKGPHNISLDIGDNTLLVADTGNSRVLRLNTDLQVTQVIGSHGTGDGQLNLPQDVVVDKSGEIIVCDTGNHRIVRFSPNGRFISSFGMQGYGRKLFNSPQGVDVDSSGNVYVADCINQKVKKFTKSGVFLAQSLILGNLIRGVRVDHENNVHVVQMDRSSVRVLKPSLVEAFSYGQKGDGDYQFNKPRSIFVSKDGQIFVSDKDTGQIKAYRVHDHSIDGSTISEVPDESPNGSTEVSAGKEAIKSPVQLTKPIVRTGQAETTLKRREEIQPKTASTPRSPGVGEVRREIVVSHDSDGSLNKTIFSDPDDKDFFWNNKILVLIGRLSTSELMTATGILDKFNSLTKDKFPLVYWLTDAKYEIPGVFSPFHICDWTKDQKVSVLRHGRPHRSEDATKIYTQGTFLQSGSSYSLWGVKETDKLVIFVLNGDGKILFRHDGLSSINEQLVLTSVKDNHDYWAGVPVERCRECFGLRERQYECESCKGRGRVKCVRCGNGYRVVRGRLEECITCSGTAHVECIKCYDDTTFRGLGVVKKTCVSCQGTGYVRKKLVQ